MSTKPTAPRVMSGTHGHVYWDNEPIYEISSASAIVKPNREDITFSGDMWTDSKLMGLSGEWSIKIKQIFSRARDLAEAFKQGKDPRSEFVFKLDDPDAYGAETVALHNCWFNDIPISDFENGKAGEKEFSGGFTSFDFMDYVKTDGTRA